MFVVYKTHIEFQRYHCAVFDKTVSMRTLFLVLGFALAVGQEFPQNQGSSSTAVLLASPGYFDRGREFEEQRFRRNFQGSQFEDPSNKSFQQNYRSGAFQQIAFRHSLQRPQDENRFRSFEKRFHSDRTLMNRGNAFKRQNDQFQDNRFPQQNQNRFGSLQKENQLPLSSFRQGNQNRFGFVQQERQSNFGFFQQDNQNRLGFFQLDDQNNRFRSNPLEQSNRKKSFNRERLFQLQNSFFRLSVDSQALYDGFAEPLNLPSGASLLMGQIDTSFQCSDRPYGYYADQGNACRIFHVCNPYLFEDGRIETHQYSFMCNEGQIFDQEKMTCVEMYSALPCEEASNFYFRNEKFSRLEKKF